MGFWSRLFGKRDIAPREDALELSRRDLLKSGVAGVALGLLFRGRSGGLQDTPVLPEQKPSAVTIACQPQRAFRPDRLIISGTVIGREMVPAKVWQPCPHCTDDEESYGCASCDYEGGRSVETGETREQDVVRIPWVLEDISINNRMQFAPGGEVPGELFSAQAIDSGLLMDTVGPGSEVRFRVRYTGDKPGGERFRAALLGRELGPDGQERRVVMPIDSGVEIVA